MKVLNNKRYDLLAKQFKLESNLSREIVKSNKRIFTYVYEQTDIFYLEDIESKALYNYVAFHLSKSKKKQKVSLSELIKDIKNFLLFLERITDVDKLPIIDLSLTNIDLWRNLGKNDTE